MTNYAAARENMLESQVRPNGITDRRILAAMGEISREMFVPELRRGVAYVDEDILVAEGANGRGPRYLIEAMAFARLVQLAEVKPTEKVLCVGAGTGYGSAVLAALAKSVVALECDPALVAEARKNLSQLDNVTVVDGNLEAGYRGEAPFDIILIEGRIAEVPTALLGQLVEGGRLVAVVGEAEMAKAQVHVGGSQGSTVRQAFDASVAALPGFARKRPAFVF